MSKRAEKEAARQAKLALYGTPLDPMRQACFGWKYNPNRRVPVRRAGWHPDTHPPPGTWEPVDINLYRLTRRSMVFSSRRFPKLLRRLHLVMSRDGNDYVISRRTFELATAEETAAARAAGRLYFGRFVEVELWRGVNTSRLMDWLLIVYLPELIGTGSVPPLPGLTPEEHERMARRAMRAEFRKRGLSPVTGQQPMTKAQAAAKARLRRG